MQGQSFFRNFQVQSFNYFADDGEFQAIDGYFILGPAIEVEDAEPAAFPVWAGCFSAKIVELRNVLDLVLRLQMVSRLVAEIFGLALGRNVLVHIKGVWF